MVYPHDFSDFPSLFQSSQNTPQCLVKTFSGFDQNNLYSFFILDDPISNSVFCIYILKMVRPDTFQGSLKFSIPIGLFREFPHLIFNSTLQMLIELSISPMCRRRHENVVLFSFTTHQLVSSLLFSAPQETDRCF